MSTDEQKITAANHGLFIQDATRKDILSLLAYLFSLTGINAEAIPKEAANEVLIDFIISSYGTFRVPEVRTAFQMNAAGRFGDVIEHYQVFSSTYFGKVMTAFRKKSQDLKLYQQQSREWNKEPDKVSIHNEIPDEEMVRLSYLNYLNVGNWQLIYPLCYDTLKKHGYGVTIEEGTKQRAAFNCLQREKTMFPESVERQFKQWLAAVIFKDFIVQGKKEIRL